MKSTLQVLGQTLGEQAIFAFGRQETSKEIFVKLTVAMIGLLLVALPFVAQQVGHQTSNLSGIWHPIVGSGGAYSARSLGSFAVPV